MILFVKSALLLLSATIFFHGFKAPTPAVDSKRDVYKGQVFEHVVHIIVYAGQSVFIGSMLGHVLVMLSLSYFPAGREHIVPMICANPSVSLSALSSLNPAFLSSVALVVAGGSLRMWCYRTLGRHFTFQVTILEGHKLVTSGPYAVVRHPSYTGGCAMIVGASLLFFARDGFVTACRVQDTPAVWLVRFWRVLAPYAAFGLIRRAWVEDAQLKHNFGQAWEAYRKAVPYRFVPYLL
ncbi:isoprenylcysteine carboxylmethyltransferase family protein [Phanerochaete sordida]|uniref:Protein-S-isoprenylcysteine O-methyltransferase n=1 Tax=Phanerochaete sordida TaxID=48140 RepID=A0A9P3G7N6_9APHY|nr:isoprenylcysteine carboxylmethyltransferase family protein [Phanerochaete sordida]